MSHLRQAPPTAWDGIPIAAIDDYATVMSMGPHTGETKTLALDQANVLHYRFADGGFVMVRPSGTEPKLKIYFSVTAASAAHADERLRTLRTAVLAHRNLL